jgi:hypothetical protein
VPNQDAPEHFTSGHPDSVGSIVVSTGQLVSEHSPLIRTEALGENLEQKNCKAGGTKPTEHSTLFGKTAI